MFNAYILTKTKSIAALVLQEESDLVMQDVQNTSIQRPAPENRDAFVNLMVTWVIPEALIHTQPHQQKSVQVAEIIWFVTALGHLFRHFAVVVLTGIITTTMSGYILANISWLRPTFIVAPMRIAISAACSRSRLPLTQTIKKLTKGAALNHGLLVPKDSSGIGILYIIKI